MGNNAAYTLFERKVINLYNSGKLDESVLSTLMESHRGTDIDSGGSVGLLTHDGKDLETVVIETMGLNLPNIPDNEDDYYEEKWSLFHTITDRFGWQ